LLEQRSCCRNQKRKRHRTIVKKLLLATLLLLPVCGAQAQTPKLHYEVGTGLPGGNYEFLGFAVREQLGVSNVTLHPSKGSGDNLDCVLKGDCQFAPAQFDAMFLFVGQHPDALGVIEIARVLYPEYAHLICNDQVKSLDELKPSNVVAVGEEGSGSQAMWQAIVKANPDKYNKVQTLPVGGTRALNRLTEGTDVQCMLFVAGLRSQRMMDANVLSKSTGGKLHLVPVYDKKLLEIKDPKGRAVYTAGKIPDSTYPEGLQKTGMFSSGKSVDTIIVQSVLVGNVKFAEANSGAYDVFLNAVTRAMPKVLNHMAPER
jgi:uncharacterized protein